MQMSSLFVYGYPLANSQKSQRLIMASCDASVMASHNEYSWETFGEAAANIARTLPQLLVMLRHTDNG